MWGRRRATDRFAVFFPDFVRFSGSDVCLLVVLVHPVSSIVFFVKVFSVIGAFCFFSFNRLAAYGAFGRGKSFFRNYLGAGENVQGGAKRIFGWKDDVRNVVSSEVLDDHSVYGYGLLFVLHTPFDLIGVVVSGEHEIDVVERLVRPENGFVESRRMSVRRVYGGVDGAERERAVVDDERNAPGEGCEAKRLSAQKDELVGEKVCSPSSDQVLGEFGGGLDVDVTFLDGAEEIGGEGGLSDSGSAVNVDEDGAHGSCS
jgi:hypothetical protein